MPRVGAGTRAQLEHLAALVERPDPREPAVQIRDERFGAALQHPIEIGRLGQREADGRGQRGERTRVVLGLLTRPHFLLERRGAFRPLAHLRSSCGGTRR